MDVPTLLSDVQEWVDFPVIEHLFSQYCISNQLYKAKCLYEFNSVACNNAIDDKLIEDVIWADAVHALDWLVHIHPCYLRWFYNEPTYIDIFMSVEHEGLRVAQWWRQNESRPLFHQIGQHDSER